MKTIFCSSWAIWPESRHLVVVGRFGRRDHIGFQSVWMLNQFSNRAEVHLDNGNVFCLTIRK